jgi:hypothetical protein
MTLALSFVGGVIFTIIVEFVALYSYSRKAANKKAQEQ